MDMSVYKRGNDPWEKEQGVTTNCDEHKAHVFRFERNEKDITNIWTAVDMIRNDIKHIFVKFGWLYGGLTVVNAAVMIGVQIFLKSQAH
jgi:hypothetical protein